MDFNFEISQWNKYLANTLANTSANTLAIFSNWVYFINKGVYVFIEIRNLKFFKKKMQFFFLFLCVHGLFSNCLLATF